MRKYRFTILELLLVISIAGVMLSVAVPAFSRMLKGSASGIAVRELMGKLNAARAYAVANKTYVAVVFPSSYDGYTEFNKRHTHRSYRACEVSSEGSFISWIPKENWNFFPAGITFGYDKNKSGSDRHNYVVRANKPETKEYEKPGDLNSVHSALVDCEVGGRSLSTAATKKSITNYIMFRPDGNIDTFPDAILIRLRDGKVDDSGIPTENGTSYYPLVIRFNGKVKFYNELVED